MTLMKIKEWTKSDVRYEYTCEHCQEKYIRDTCRECAYWTFRQINENYVKIWSYMMGIKQYCLESELLFKKVVLKHWWAMWVSVGQAEKCKSFELPRK